MSKDLTKYVLVPYEEYQELLALKQKQEQEMKYEIYFRPLEEFFGYDIELSVRAYRVLTDLIDGKFSLCKRDKAHERYEYPNRPEDVMNRLRKFKYVGDLVSKSDYDLLFLSEFGRKSLNELKEQLRDYKSRSGFELRLNTELPQLVKEKLDKLR